MMALVSELAQAIAAELFYPHPTVAIFARRLRDADLLSKKGRGRGAAHATPLDCARLLIPLLANSSATDAPECVRDFGNLVCHPLEKYRRIKKDDGSTQDVLISNFTMANAYGLASGHTFEQAFAAVIAGFAGRIDPPPISVVIYDTGLAAQINLDGNRYDYRHKNETITYDDGRLEMGRDYIATISKYKRGIDSRREIGTDVLRKIALVVNGQKGS